MSKVTINHGGVSLDRNPYDVLIGMFLMAAIDLGVAAFTGNYQPLISLAILVPSAAFLSRLGDHETLAKAMRLIARKGGEA